MVTCSDYTLTGNTRYAMRGIFKRRPCLQVEEAYTETEMDTNTFNSRTTSEKRWRWINDADKLNLEMGIGE